MSEITDNVNQERRRQERIGPIDAAARTPDQQARQEQPQAGQGDALGYWNGETFVSYFRLGVSALGGPDVLK